MSDEEIKSALDGGFFQLSDNTALAHAGAAISCVATPLKDQVPDLSAVEEAGIAVGRHLQPDELVILQSTSYPGMIQDMLQPLLEQH